MDDDDDDAFISEDSEEELACVITKAIEEEKSQVRPVHPKRKYDRARAAETKKRNHRRRQLGEVVSPPYKPKSSDGITRKYIKSGKFRCAPNTSGIPRRPRNFGNRTKSAYEVKESIFLKANTTAFEDKTTAVGECADVEISARIASAAALAAMDACTSSDISEFSKTPLQISPLGKKDSSMDPIFYAVDALVALDKSPAYYDSSKFEALSPKTKLRIAMQREIAKPEFTQTSLLNIVT